MRAALELGSGIEFPLTLSSPSDPRLLGEVGDLDFLEKSGISTSRIILDCYITIDLNCDRLA
ncbi:hypothetical protein [Coleofasciculus sp. H7-2]|uniref:hypothetical protein n=1 Tax=Coleofasciculus sp. H7-2 TaxID=3351545 RepID=UPI00366A675C